jgi:hypothetical protein
MISLFIPIIMTLLAAKHISTKHPDNVAQKTTSNADDHNNQDRKDFKQWNVRPYNPTLDQEHLVEICKDIYGGSDYLPSSAIAYHNDPNCDFQVLCCPKTNIPVACANLRCIARNTNGVGGSSAVFWSEAVRTSSKHRNQGLAYHLLQSQLQQTRVAASDDQSMPMPTTQIQILSCTVQSNHAMGRVFDKIGMKHTSTIRLLQFDTLKALPGWAAAAADSADIPCTKQQHLLGALNLQDLISDSVKQQSQAQWSVVTSAKEACQLLQDVQSLGGGHGVDDNEQYCMPGFYELIHVHSSRFQESLEQGLVFSLTSTTTTDGILLSLPPPAIMAFVRDPRLTSLKSNWVLCVATTTEENLQSALWEGCTSPDIQRKLKKRQQSRSDISKTQPQNQKDIDNHDDEAILVGFALAFDGAIPIDGRFCSKLSLANDPCFVYGMDLMESRIQKTSSD